MKLPSIGSDNGLAPGRRQAIIWTNAGILLIGPLWTNFSEILIEIPTFSFKKMRLKVSSAKWRPFCLGLNVLRGGHGLPHSLEQLNADVRWTIEVVIDINRMIEFSWNLHVSTRNVIFQR